MRKLPTQSDFPPLRTRCLSRPLKTVVFFHIRGSAGEVVIEFCMSFFSDNLQLIRVQLTSLKSLGRHASILHQYYIDIVVPDKKDILTFSYLSFIPDNPWRAEGAGFMVNAL